MTAQVGDGMAKAAAPCRWRRRPVVDFAGVRAGDPRTKGEAARRNLRGLHRFDFFSLDGI